MFEQIAPDESLRLRSSVSLSCSEAEREAGDVGERVKAAAPARPRPVVAWGSVEELRARVTTLDNWVEHWNDHPSGARPPTKSSTTLPHISNDSRHYGHPSPLGGGDGIGSVDGPPGWDLLTVPMYQPGPGALL
jgi:hypothetical protein